MRHSMAWPRWRSSSWRKGSGCAGRHAELQLHQVDPGHELGDGMLHLQARVHLQEVEVALLVHQELQRAGVDVAGGAHGCDGRLAHAPAQPVVQQRGGSLLDDLLVAALHGTLALEEVHGVAVVVAEHLELHVVGPLDELLQVDAVVPEGVGGLAAGGFQGVGEICCLAHDPHALTAAPGCGLDQQREADFRRCGQQVVVPLAGLIARHDGHAGRLHDRPRRGLGAHETHGGRRRADERDPGVRHGIGEIGILGEEAIAGVDRVAAPFERGGDDALTAQVRFPRRGRANSDRFVSQCHMQRTGVRVGIDGDGGDAQLLAGTNDADGDLAAVGDEDFTKHGC